MASVDSFIKPTVAQSEDVLQLSTVDQIMPRKYMCSAFCFKLDDTVSVDLVSSRLKTALASTLGVLPQFAGELQMRPGDQNHLHVYTGPNSNVLFRDQRGWTGAEYATLAAARFPASLLPAAELCVPEADGVTENGGLRTFLVQANYIPGGLLLVVQAHHSFTDARGVELFIQVWSRQMSAQSQGRAGEIQHFDEEALERWRLSYGSRKVKVDDFQEFRDEPILPLGTPGGKVDTVIPVIWSIQGDRQEELKNLASSQSSTTSHVSKAEALSAFLFRHICKARFGHVPEGKDRPTTLTLYFTSNLRTRMEPALPEAYLGNASMVVPVRLSFDQVCEGNDDVVLNNIAREIQKAVNACDTTTVRKIVGIYNSKPIGALKPNLGYYPGPNLMSADISGNVAYDMDWGNLLGQIDCFRTVGNTMSTANCSVQPKLRDGSVEIFMQHESRVIESMKSNVEFTRFASFVNS